MFVYLCICVLVCNVYVYEMTVFQFFKENDTVLLHCLKEIYKNNVTNLSIPEMFC